MDDNTSQIELQILLRRCEVLERALELVCDKIWSRHPSEASGTVGLTMDSFIKQAVQEVKQDADSQ
jgi:hypothetical protein